jgi:hypothetical protein
MVGLSLREGGMSQKARSNLSRELTRQRLKKEKETEL